MAKQKRSAGEGVGTRSGRGTDASSGSSKSNTSGQDASKVDETTHRGIEWQKAASGRMRWWDDEDKRWVIYKAGKDAPPRPLGWEDEARKTAPPLTRPPWSSPFRLIPLFIFLAILVYGSWQAFHPSTKGASKAAHALQGKCLRQTGRDKSGPAYSDKPVVCTPPQAAVKVMAVLGPAAGKGSAAPSGCPAQWQLTVLLAHTTTPYFACVAPLPQGPNPVGT